MKHPLSYRVNYCEVPSDLSLRMRMAAAGLTDGPFASFARPLIAVAVVDGLT